LHGDNASSILVFGMYKKAIEDIRHNDSRVKEQMLNDIIQIYVKNNHKQKASNPITVADDSYEVSCNKEIVNIPDPGEYMDVEEWFGV